MADDQPRRPADGERVVHVQRRHAVRAVGTAAALSGVRRPRQQPRRLHAEHDRVARDRAGLARLGAEHRLRAPPVVAVSDAHLAAAVLGADRQRRAVPDVARGQHDRHGDREGPRGARAGRRHAHGHGVRRVVSRLHRLRAELQERPGVLDRDGALPVRDAARVHDRRLPRELSRPAAAEPLPEPVASGLVAARRRGRLHADGIAGGARVRVEVQGVAALQSLHGRPRSDCARPERSAVCLLHPAGAARSGRRRRVAAPARVWRRARLAVDGAGDGRRRDVSRGHVGRADRSGVRGDGAAGAQRAELSGHAPVPGRSAPASVRRGRVDAAAPDGRARRRGRHAADRRGSREPETAGPGAGSQAEADALQLRRVAGCRAVRQRAGHRLRLQSQRGGHRAAGGTRDGLGPGPRRRSRAEQRVPRGQPRVEGRDRRERAVDRGHDGRALRHQRPAGVGAGRARACVGARGGTHDGVRNAAAAAAHRPLPSLGFQHGRGVDALGARTVRLRDRHAPAGRLSRAAAAEGGRRHPDRGWTDSRGGQRRRSRRGRGAGPAAAAVRACGPSTRTS